jgi:hypothetical protein
MRIVDDYNAKLRLWVSNPRVVPLPAGPTLPKFRAQKFRTHAEMNRWKEDLLRQLVRESAASRG